MAQSAAELLKKKYSFKEVSDHQLIAINEKNASSKNRKHQVSNFSNQHLIL